jgi:hypothetical protein
MPRLVWVTVGAVMVPSGAMTERMTVASTSWPSAS